MRRDPGEPGKDANGIFVLNKATRLKDIIDGTTKTAILGERAWEVNLGDGLVFGARWRGIWNSRRAGSFEIGLADTLGCGKYQMNYSTPVTADPKAESFARRGFSSRHRGGSQFALADGSVRFIADTVSGDFDASQQTKTDTVDSPWEALLGKNDAVPLGNID